MWVVMGDEWCERQLNRREYNEDFSEQGFAPAPKGQAGLPTLLRQQSGREAQSAGTLWFKKVRYPVV
jgi:hypothetical protein